MNASARPGIDAFANSSNHGSSICRLALRPTLGDDVDLVMPVGVVMPAEMRQLRWIMS